MVLSGRDEKAIGMIKILPVRSEERLPLLIMDGKCSSRR